MTDAEDTAARAAIYARQSKGSTKSVAEQVDEGKADCEERGWAVHDVYADLVSASRYSHKPRQDWDRLLADLKAEDFTVLWLWESSRGDRRARWWLDLLDDCLDHAVLIHIGDDERTYDLSIPTDWNVLAQSGVASDYESRRTSSRIKRDVRANARKGRPHGGVLYGYKRIYKDTTGELDRQVPHPRQAPVVREIVSRIAAGEAVATVAHDLDSRHVRPARGKAWNRASVRKIAMNQAYVGYRRYKGDWLASPEWFPPIADEAEFWTALQRMQDRGGVPHEKASLPASIKHLLSYIAECGGCGTPMGIYRRTGNRPYFVYRCNTNGCASIRENWLDAYVTGHACTRLDTPAFWDELLRGDDDAVDKARAREAELKAMLQGYRALARKGEILAESYKDIETGLTAQIREAARVAARSAAPPSLLSIWRDRGTRTIRELFEGKPMGVRRDIIENLYAGVIVTPAGLNRSVRDRERVRMVPHVPRRPGEIRPTSDEGEAP